MQQVVTEDYLPEDEYLRPQDLQELRDVLRDNLDRILTKSQQAVSKLTAEDQSEADTLDIAVNASNRDFMLRLAGRERRMLGKIRYALGRIGEGEYGACESCGEAITHGRLLARPVATLCIDCKTEAEQLRSNRKVF